MNCLFLFFYKIESLLFLCVIKSAEKNASIHNIELICYNHAERPRFETRTCLLVFISDRAYENTYIEMHACCCRFHQQELKPFSHFACLQDHSTFSWASFQKDQRTCCVPWKCLIGSRFLGCHAT